MTEYEVHKLIEQQEPEAKKRVYAKIQSKLLEEQKALKNVEPARKTTIETPYNTNNDEIQHAKGGDKNCSEYCSKK